MNLLNNILFWNIVTFAYFYIKNYILSKIDKTERFKPPLLYIGTTILAFYLNHKILNDYNRYLEMSYVKGAVKLPPFTLLFLSADLISSIILFIIFYSKIGEKISMPPVSKAIIDIFRLFLVYIIFSLIVSNFWLKETQKNLNWDYQCFSYQLAVNLADHYYRYDRLPERLEEFTDFKVNPINESKLIYNPGTLLTVSIVDEEGNKIVEGYDDLMGIKTYKERPSDFFRFYRVSNENLCQGRLEIPSEYR